MAKPLTDVNQAINAILGLVRPNRFSVEINLPCANWKPERIESVEFPAYGLETIDGRYNNQPIMKIPYTLQPAYSCNITFRADNKGAVLQGLYKCIDAAIINTSGDTFIKYAQDLWGTIKIEAYNPDDTKCYGLELQNVILTNIDTVQHSYDEQDSYLKQTATFSYQSASLTQ
jgi:hypothetical protein